MNKFLCYMAILSSIVFVNIEVNANTSLRDILSDSSKTAIFNGDTISCTDGIVDQNDYTHNNKTTYINTNTIPLLSNTGGGSKGKYK